MITSTELDHRVSLAGEPHITSCKSTRASPARAENVSPRGGGFSPRGGGFGSALWPILLTLLLLGGCADRTPEIEETGDRALTEEELAIEPPAPGAPRELGWDELIPADWRPERLMEDYDVDNLSHEDPRALELMEKLEALWAEAPVVETLDGSQVRLPGFVVPLETDASAIREFLLVPYFGACIHVPPPPANQTVLVTTATDRPYPGGLFDTVWVEGRMRVEPFSDDLGDAGYRIEDATVTLYEES